jgi:hypothetical protein
MSNRFRDGGWGNDSGGAGGATQFFGQMLTMPFSAFVYSMQLFIQMLQGANNRGGGMGCGGAPCGGAGQALNSGTQQVGGWAAAAGGAGNTSQTTRKERNMSDQSWGGGGGQGSGGQGYGGQGYGGGQGQGYGQGQQGWSVRDDCRNLEPCDQLRLVRYKILFLKRDLEVAFPEEEELVAEEMNESGFIAWKTAEFIQKMSRQEVRQPPKWAEKKYPTAVGGGMVIEVTEGGKKVNYVTALPDQDKRHLRVFVQVLATYDRERTYYERDQVQVLKEIRDRLG